MKHIICYFHCFLCFASVVIKGESSHSDWHLLLLPSLSVNQTLLITTAVLSHSKPSLNFIRVLHLKNLLEISHFLLIKVLYIIDWFHTSIKVQRIWKSLWRIKSECISHRLTLWLHNHFRFPGNCADILFYVWFKSLQLRKTNCTKQLTDKTVNDQ